MKRSGERSGSRGQATWIEVGVTGQAVSARRMSWADMRWREWWQDGMSGMTYLRFMGPMMGRRKRYWQEENEPVHRAQRPRTEGG